MKASDCGSCLGLRYVYMAQVPRMQMAVSSGNGWQPNAVVLAHANHLSDCGAADHVTTNGMARCDVTSNASTEKQVL